MKVLHMPIAMLSRCRGHVGRFGKLLRLGAVRHLAVKALPSFDPDNGQVIFANQSTWQLTFSWLLLSLCRHRILVDLGSKILGQSWICREPQRLTSRALLASVRSTAFAHFCGGETLQDCVGRGKHLSSAGVRCIVDWGVEESSEPAAWETNMLRKVETLQRAKEVLGLSAAFMPIKLTSILSPALLERWTAVVQDGSQPPEDWHLEEEVAAALQRLRRICEAAKDAAIPLLLDAEQSGRQPAVHLLARQLQREFNTEEPIVYDTVQMYLKASPQRLDQALHYAGQHGYIYAVKLVRGAYIEQERPFGTIFDTKEDTDAAFETAAEKILQAIVTKRPSAALMLATHNRSSLFNAVQMMEKLGLARNDQRVHFAQILGMVDNLTYALGLAGYNASKLLVFGQIHEALDLLGSSVVAAPHAGEPRCIWGSGARTPSAEK
ncbi:unnamed protein product [Durusdinium trenchii]|uniref:Proline dehydrogenase n=1 Tax=Durusdinium trenchii TaxID=1381693 RepID=A0ABP0SZ53_9DINO